MRKACRDYSEKDTQGRKTIRCYTCNKKNTIGVKVRFNKKATETQYTQFKETVEIHTNATTNLISEKGFVYFDVLVDLQPISVYQGDNYSVTIGTGANGLLHWDWVHNPHLLIVAETGQGKSTFIRYLLSGLLSAENEVWIIDGKAIDYYQYRSLFSRYISNEVTNINDILAFVHQFRLFMLKRQQDLKDLGITDYTEDPQKQLKVKFLIIEEYIVLLDCMNKKQREAFEEDIRAILLLGRACGYDLIITMQRGDTAYIKGAMRDNFMCRLLLGSASDTSARMMFDETVKGLELGQAWIKQGNKLEVMAIPYFKEIMSDSNKTS